MCGRYSIAANAETLRRQFHFENGTPDLRPRYNAAPGQDLPIVRLNKEGNRKLVMLRWGLIPPWTDDPKIGQSTINAQVETLHRMPAFRSAFRKRRCLVVADGFYKWHVTSDGKQPYRFTMKDGAPFAMAGLWERWDRGGEPVETFAIIVTVANEIVRPIHDRMPVILPPPTYGEWLESPGPTIPMALLHFHPAADMIAYPVSRRLNSPDHDEAEMIARAT